MEKIIGSSSHEWLSVFSLANLWLYFPIYLKSFLRSVKFTTVKRKKKESKMKEEKKARCGYIELECGC